MPNLIKIILAILLLLCLLEMPYGFYEMVRFIAMVGFAFLAFEANKKEVQTATIIYLVLALLFQPFFKIALGRTLWNIMDVVVAVGLIASIFIDPIPKNSKND